MIHDPDLTDLLSGLPSEKFDGEVFRATGMTTNPIAASANGGRWAPRPIGGDPGVPVLYTSFERDGALAEVVSYLAELQPMPSKPLRVHRLGVSSSKSVRLIRADLAQLGVDLGQYGQRNYGRTQEIGAALNFLGFDGLMAPSARWPCDNLMIFMDNHDWTKEHLDPLDATDVDWRAWARDHDFI